MNDLKIVDSNVHLGRWPFRRLPGDEPAELVARLRERGVVEAWAGAFDGVFHRDLAGVNARLAEECGRHGGLLIPFGSVNPALPGWERDLADCRERWNMPGVRLHPGYHGYTLDDERFAAMLAAAAEQKLIVQIAVSLEDERTQPALARAPQIDTAPIVSLLRRHPAAKVQLLNALRSANAGPILDVVAAGIVYVDIAMLEGLAGIERLLRTFPLDRIAFGSHSPFFIFESARLKLEESRLTPAQREAITQNNARVLLPRA